MIQQFFSLNDIQEFLDKCGLKWTGQIFDNETSKVKPAQLKDFENGRICTLIFYSPSAILQDKDLSITNFTFVELANDEKLSNDGTPFISHYFNTKWCKFLLNKYKENYAKPFYIWIVDQMIRIKQGLKQDFKNLAKEDQQQINKELDYYENLSYLAIHHMSYNEILSINEKAIEKANSLMPTEVITT